MKIGIDGNMWYCSNGLGLGNLDAEFVFKRTLRKAFIEFQSKFFDGASVPESMIEYLDKTPEEYNKENQ